MRQEKVVMVTGGNGQDGTLMFELLNRRAEGDIIVVYKEDLDLRDRLSVRDAIESVKPDFFINFAALSSPNKSVIQIEDTFETNLNSVIYQLDAIKDFCPNCRYFNAGSVLELDEYQTTFSPDTPYAQSKLAAHWIVKNYRDTYGIYAVQGILGLHESKHRSGTSLIKRIISQALKIKDAISEGEAFDPVEIYNKKEFINLSSAKETVELIWRQMNLDKPEDFILKNTAPVSLEEVVETVFNRIDIDGYWSENHFVIPSYGINFEKLRSSILCASEEVGKEESFALTVPKKVVYSTKTVGQIISEII